MPNMLAPHLNEQVLGECILGIEYNAKNAGTTSESASIRRLALCTMPNMLAPYLNKEVLGDGIV